MDKKVERSSSRFKAIGWLVQGELESRCMSISDGNTLQM